MKGVSCVNCNNNIDFISEIWGLCLSCHSLMMTRTKEQLIETIVKGSISMQKLTFKANEMREELDDLEHYAMDLDLMN